MFGVVISLFVLTPLLVFGAEPRSRVGQDTDNSTPKTWDTESTISEYCSVYPNVPTITSSYFTQYHLYSSTESLEWTGGISETLLIVDNSTGTAIPSQSVGWYWLHEHKTGFGGYVAIPFQIADNCGTEVPPIPPSGSGGLDNIFSVATSTFKQVTGIEYTDIVAWSGSMTLLIIGNGLAVLSNLMPWIYAILIFGAVFGLIFSGFRFFRH